MYEHGFAITSLAPSCNRCRFGRPDPISQWTPLIDASLIYDPRGLREFVTERCDTFESAARCVPTSPVKVQTACDHWIRHIYINNLHHNNIILIMIGLAKSVRRACGLFVVKHSICSWLRNMANIAFGCSMHPTWTATSNRLITRTSIFVLQHPFAEILRKSSLVLDNNGLSLGLLLFWLREINCMSKITKTWVE